MIKMLNLMAISGITHQSRQWYLSCTFHLAKQVCRPGQQREFTLLLFSCVPSVEVVEWVKVVEQLGSYSTWHMERQWWDSRSQRMYCGFGQSLGSLFQMNLLLTIFIHVTKKNDYKVGWKNKQLLMLAYHGQSCKVV